MTIKNILVYLEPRTSLEPISQYTINLANIYEARIWALAIIKHPTPQVKSRADELAWQRLYEIEEDAFSAGVKISLLLEEVEAINQTNLTQKIISIITNFNIDLVILYSNAKVNFKDLMSRINIPIIIYPIELKM